MVAAAAAAHGLTIDYVARESGCAAADGVEVAELVLEPLVAEPHAGHHRQPARRPSETGWLCNGERSPGSGRRPGDDRRSRGSRRGRTRANRHSIFVDVELWIREGRPARGRARSWPRSGSWPGWACSGTAASGGHAAVPASASCPTWDELPAWSS